MCLSQQLPIDEQRQVVAVADMIGCIFHLLIIALHFTIGKVNYQELARVAVYLFLRNTPTTIMMMPMTVPVICLYPNLPGAAPNPVMSAVSDKTATINPTTMMMRLSVRLSTISNHLLE
jgi:hypothetical protein